MGTIFKVTTFGESHGAGVGAVVDGCPAGLPLTEADIQRQLDRRRPGQSGLTTPRNERDEVTILSGTEKGVTLGTPIGLLVGNRDQRPEEYGDTQAIPRPSHADFTYQIKYGMRASSGGGRSSARETVGRVAGGAVAEQWLSRAHGVSITAWVSAVGGVALSDGAGAEYRRDDVDRHPVRCPDAETAKAMEALIQRCREENDSVGGMVTCVCRGVPAGWGEPVFDKLEAALAQAMLSIPAAKGFDVGSGFAAAGMRGSAHNDPFVMKKRGLGTLTNHSGGIQGGISNGEPIVFRVAFKPPATISRPQETSDFEGRTQSLSVQGRHDPCIVPRAVPVVEAMAALALADAALRQHARADAQAGLSMQKTADSV